MSKAKKQKNANKHRALSAQQTIPYIAMHPDGICQLPGGLYTKTLEYEDINYAVASTEDQTAIISGWSACLNYFDSSLPFQLSFVNRRSRSGSRYKVNISEADDRFNSVRTEYTGMLKNQIAKSNNGIERAKLVDVLIFQRFCVDTAGELTNAVWQHPHIGNGLLGRYGRRTITGPRQAF